MKKQVKCEVKKGFDPVSLPAHYFDGRRLTLTEIVVDLWRGIESYFFGNALKYMMRCGRKPGADEVEDIKKAIRYLEMFCEVKESERNGTGR